MSSMYKIHQRLFRNFFSFLYKNGGGMVMQRKIYFAILLIPFLLLLTSCGGALQSGSDNNESNSGKNGGGSEVVKIGSIATFSGPFAMYGEHIRNGFELYLEQNDNKMGGREVEMIYEDSTGDTRTALRKYRQLVDSEGVDIIIGPILSDEAYALRDQAENDKQLIISTNAASNGLSWDKKSDYVFRVASPSNWQNSRPTAEYIANHIGKNAVVLAPDYDAGHESIESFKEAFENAGGTVVEEIYPDLGENDYASYLINIKELNPDVVWVFLSGNDLFTFVKQYKEFGLKDEIPLVGDRSMTDNVFIEEVGDIAEGIVSGVYYLPNFDNEVNKKFVEDYTAKHGAEPNYLAFQGYGAAQAIAKAIEEADSTDSDALSEVLKGLTFESPSGPITIDPEMHNPIMNFYVVINRLEDGEMIQEIVEEVQEVKMPSTQ